VDRASHRANGNDRSAGALRRWMASLASIMLASRKKSAPVRLAEEQYLYLWSISMCREADRDNEREFAVGDLGWRWWKWSGALDQVERRGVEKGRPGALYDPAAH
jgi:hypothetical protein